MASRLQLCGGMRSEAMSFPFQKYEGLGNDFILISADDLPEGEVSAEQARQWCDRNFGVGADGVIVVDRHAQALAMRVLNADGSTPEMCGNGLRCVALYALNHGWVSDPDFEVATDAGPHRCVVDQRTGRVIVQMRSASFEPAARPAGPAPITKASQLIVSMAGTSSCSGERIHSVTATNRLRERT